MKWAGLWAKSRKVNIFYFKPNVTVNIDTVLAKQTNSNWITTEIILQWYKQPKCMFSVSYSKLLTLIQSIDA